MEINYKTEGEREMEHENLLHVIFHFHVPLFPCFETAFCVWLARLPDFSQIIPCKLAFQRADMYNSNL